MFPWVFSEAEAEIALGSRCADGIILKGSFCFNICVKTNSLKGAIRDSFEDFALGFIPKIIDFIQLRIEIGRPLAAKLSANFLVSS